MYLGIFPGQYYDSETGLHYNWFRYYNPETGRYIRTDPLGFGGGDLNLYLYAGANPVMFTDPFGLKHWGPDYYGDWRDGTPLVLFHPKQYSHLNKDCMKKCFYSVVLQIAEEEMLEEIGFHFIKKYGLKIAKKAIPYYSMVDNVLDAYQIIKCFNGCKKGCEDGKQ